VQHPSPQLSQRFGRHTPHDKRPHETSYDVPYISGMVEEAGYHSAVQASLKTPPGGQNTANSPNKRAMAWTSPRFRISQPIAQPRRTEHSCWNRPQEKVYLLSASRITVDHESAELSGVPSAQDRSCSKNPTCAYLAAGRLISRLQSLHLPSIQTVCTRPSNSGGAPSGPINPQKALAVRGFRESMTEQQVIPLHQRTKEAIQSH